MEQFYSSVLSFINKYPRLKKIIISITKYTPYIPFCIYPLLVLYVFLFYQHLLFNTLVKPAIAFILLSLFRKLINRKRPYEVYNIEALLIHKKGQSFPSRHTLSAMIIAFISFDIHLYLGIFMLILAVIIGISRIISGLHFISDVVAGSVFAYLIYIIL